jgi:hypothetical protein
LSLTKILLLPQRAMMNSNYIVNDQIRELAFIIRESVNKYAQNNKPESSFEDTVFDLIIDSKLHNPWFIPLHMVYALYSLADDLEFLASKIRESQVIKDGSLLSNKSGWLLRTSSPLEGVAELVYFAAIGLSCEIKVDALLSFTLKKVISLIEICPKLAGRLALNEGSFIGINSIIAMTGLNSTQLEYFNKYPVLELAGKGVSLIITGNEDDKQLSILADSICQYFGRSSQSVKVIFVPESYEIENIRRSMSRFSEQLYNNRYYNNYEYRKSSLIFNKIAYNEIPPVIITEDPTQAGYISILCVQRYKDLDDIYKNDLTTRFPVSNSVNKILIHNECTLSLSGFQSNLPIIEQFIEKHQLNW